MSEKLMGDNKNLGLSDIATAAAVMTAVRVMQRIGNSGSDPQLSEEIHDERPSLHGTIIRRIAAIVSIPVAVAGFIHMTSGTESDSITSPTPYWLEPVEECQSTLPPNYTHDTQNLIVKHWLAQGVDLSDVVIVTDYRTSESCTSLTWGTNFGPSYNPNTDTIDLSNIESVLPSSDPEVNVWVAQAHENGHAVQDIQGILYQNDVVSSELQADCYAGQVIGALKPTITETSLEMISNIGDYEHGTGEQRRQALLRGIQGHDCHPDSITALRKDYPDIS